MPIFQDYRKKHDSSGDWLNRKLFIWLFSSLAFIPLVQNSSYTKYKETKFSKKTVDLDQFNSAHP